MTGNPGNGPWTAPDGSATVPRPTPCSAVYGDPGGQYGPVERLRLAAARVEQRGVGPQVAAPLAAWLRAEATDFDEWGPVTDSPPPAVADTILNGDTP